MYKHADDPPPDHPALQRITADTPFGTPLNPSQAQGKAPA
jgi:hypothetical protein